ncbi:MAG: hypothetical protein HUU16_06960 [Candidatus Omnitrophica bacterium]|nr:hypothetical protein [bacterium]NUN95896.1 hypothetical protein [Candidatus Omnitrophota bacterium]
MAGVHFSERIDLRRLLRKEIYPRLEKELDRAFPVFKFQKGQHGFWIATDAPVTFAGYGYREGKMIARGWGYRTSKQGMPAGLWLAFVNKGVLPIGQDFVKAVQALAAKVGVVMDDWDYPDLEVFRISIEERRDRMLEAFFAWAQGELHGAEGQYARNWLTSTTQKHSIGLPPNMLPELEIGFYSSPEAARQAIRDAGFDQPEDTNFAETLGLFNPRWEGRVVGPGWDINGERVVNIWGRFPGDTPMDQPVYCNLFRPSFDQPFGGTETPVNLHLAKRHGKTNLVMVESPLKAILAYSLGMLDPFPIAACGVPNSGQAEELQNYIRRSGSVTFNLDFVPDSPNKYARTEEAIRNFRNVKFPVYVINPEDMAKAMGGIYTKEVCPARFMRAMNIQGYRSLMGRRKTPDIFLAQTGSRAARGAEESRENVLANAQELIAEEELETKTTRASYMDVEIPENEEAAAPLQRPARFLSDESAAPVRTETRVDYAEGDGSPRRNIGLMARNIKTTYEKIATEIEQGRITTDQAMIILMRSQEGIQSLLDAVLKKRGVISDQA